MLRLLFGGRRLPDTTLEGAMNSERLRSNLEAVQDRIDRAALASSAREPGAITLVAVTKRNPPEQVRPLLALGVRDLGENYPQELWAKVEALADLPVALAPDRTPARQQGQEDPADGPDDPCRRFPQAARDTRRAGGRASPTRPAVCLQVNTSDEPAKHGWSPADPLTPRQSPPAGTSRSSG